MSKFSRGAILYDFLEVPGGAERVVLELAHDFSSDLYVGYRKYGVSETLGIDTASKVISLELDASLLPLRLLRLFHGFTYRSKFLVDLPWVIYSGNYAPLAVRNHTSGLNVYYCHTLPRFIYDLKGYYQERFRGIRQLPLHALVRLLQPRYEDALNRMDIIIANSENVRSRIQKYLGLDATVIYPPCPVEDRKWCGQGDYYLSLARTEPYKRVELLVKAFIKMPDKKLIIASGGSDLKRLTALAERSNNIYFTGWLNEIELSELIGNAIATLYIPKDEDFGMSPVESMASGKPVIGVSEGGLLETVVHNVTGKLISANPSIDDIINAVEIMTPSFAYDMKSECEKRAQLFSRDAFSRKMRNIIGF